MTSGKAPPYVGASVRFLANAFWRHPRRMRSRRETSLRLTAKICRERFDSTSCAFLSNNHFSPGYVDYPQETIQTYVVHQQEFLWNNTRTKSCPARSI